MSDWEVVPNEQASQPSQPQSDWEVVPPVASSQNPQSDEGIGTSLLKAPYRIAEDAYKGVGNLITNIPKYLQTGKSELSGLPQTAVAHPGHLAAQALAGLPELGHNLINTPASIVDYGVNRLHLLPESASQNILRQPDISKDVNQTFGEPQYPGEALTRGVVRNLPAVLTGTKAATDLLSAGKNALTSINPEKVAASIQNSHDVLKNSAGNSFSQVEKGVNDRNISMVPLRSNLIADISDHPLMPKTQKMQSILDRAHSGDYSGLRDLQSELWTRGTAAIKSPLVSERNAGEELFDLRDQVNNAIHDHLVNTGNNDLADTLNQGRSQYKLLKDTYYSKKTPNAIKNLVDPESRKIPNNLMDVLSQQSKPMDRIKQQNPFADLKTEQYKRKDASWKKIKTAGKIGSGILTGIGANSLINKIRNNQ